MGVSTGAEQSRPAAAIGTALAEPAPRVVTTTAAAAAHPTIRDVRRTANERTMLISLLGVRRRHLLAGCSAWRRYSARLAHHDEGSTRSRPSFRPRYRRLARSVSRGSGRATRGVETP